MTRDRRDPREVAALFGENLRRQREDRGMSQTGMAILTSFHSTAISALERGTRNPRIDTAVRLADALGIPVAELLKGIELPSDGGAGK